jgi:hypothetical protein
MKIAGKPIDFGLLNTHTRLGLQQLFGHVARNLQGLLNGAAG